MNDLAINYHYASAYHRAATTHEVAAKSGDRIDLHRDDDLINRIIDGGNSVHRPRTKSSPEWKNDMGGRPKAATDKKITRARALNASGLTVREAAARLKIGKSALYAAMAENKDSRFHR